jgi:hypothetical protein
MKGILQALVNIKELVDRPEALYADDLAEGRRDT